MWGLVPGMNAGCKTNSMVLDAVRLRFRAGCTQMCCLTFSYMPAAASLDSPSAVYLPSCSRESRGGVGNGTLWVREKRKAGCQARGQPTHACLAARAVEQLAKQDAPLAAQKAGRRASTGKRGG